MHGLRSCEAGDGEPQPELTEMRLPPLFVLNIRGAFAVSCPDVHLGTGRMQKRASRKSLKEARNPSVGRGQQLLALQRGGVGKEWGYLRTVCERKGHTHEATGEPHRMSRVGGCAKVKPGALSVNSPQ